MMKNGFGSRGNVNINSSESSYRIKSSYIIFGVITGLIFQAIVLLIVHFGYQATFGVTMMLLLLMAIGDVFFVLVSLYSSRLYLREEMMDMALMFASYNPEILNGGGSILGHTATLFKEARTEATHYAQLISELEQLKNTYQNLIANSQDMSGNVAPLPGRGNMAFVPFVDAE